MSFSGFGDQRSGTDFAFAASPWNPETFSGLGLVRAVIAGAASLSTATRL
jgi:hypothetical protein